MSDVKIEDLNATPFFARFLENQQDESMTREQMAQVRGGTGFVTMVYPSDQENTPSAGYPDWVTDIFPQIGEPGGFPNFPDFGGVLPEYRDPQGPIVTTRAPSDDETFFDLT